MSAIKTFSQALPILAIHGLEVVPAGNKLWRVGAMTYDKGGVIILARKYEQEANNVTTTEIDAPPTALSVQMQTYAQGYIDARKRAGHAWLDMGRFLSEARALAKYGEWSVFLEATQTSEDWAKRLIAIYAQSLHDQRFADAMRTNFLSVATGYELTSAPPDVQDRLLSAETPPTQRQIRDEKHAAKSAAPPTLEIAQPFWQALSSNHPTAHLWTQERPDLWRSACGVVTQNRAPAGSTQGGHCSSCVRATWPQNAQPAVPAPSPLTVNGQPRPRPMAGLAPNPYLRVHFRHSRDRIETDLDDGLHTQLAARGYTWESAAITPDGRWHHVLSSRNRALLRNDGERMRRERIALLLAPDLADILKRLDAHGYAKSGTREKGSTTFYSFRDYSGRSDETGGEIELAEGELSFWLVELDEKAKHAQQRQEAFLDAQLRAERLGYTLERYNALFRLFTPGRGSYEQGTLDGLLRSIAIIEKNAAKAAAPTLADLDAQLSKQLERAGYFWQSAQPPVIAHNDGWRGDARTVESALQLAQDREQAKAKASTQRLSAGDHVNALTLLTSIRACLIAEQISDAAENTRRLLTLLTDAQAAPVQQAMDVAPPVSPLAAIRADFRDIKAQDHDGSADAWRAQLAELVALRKRLDALADAPDVSDLEFDALSADIGGLQADISRWIEEASE